MIDCTRPSIRRRVYAGIAVLFFALGVGAAGVKAVVKNLPLDLVTSDGRGYYMFLPTLVVDGDLDFTNQIRDHFGVDFHPALLERRTPTGLVENFYPIGLALSLLPAFLAGHLIALASGGLIAANGYTSPYQLLCFALILFYVYRTLVRMDEMIADRLDMGAGQAMLSCLTIALCTPYCYYAWREPFMVHAVSAFWCTEVAAVALGAVTRPAWFWGWISFCGAMACVCRPTNIHMVPAALTGCYLMARQVGFTGMATTVPWILTAAIPVVAQMLVWKVMGGKYIYYSYGGYTFDFSRPMLFATLFSSNHGLYFWSPILLVASVGLCFCRDVVVRAWGLGGLGLWYANSSWCWWWFGDAFGARSFVELSGLFAIGLAHALQKVSDKPRLVAAMIALSLVYNFVLMALYIGHFIPRGDYLF